MDGMVWKDRRVLVVGMARSGFALAELLLALGARPILNDTRSAIDGIEAFAARGCVLALGQPAQELAPDAEAVIISPAVLPDAPVIQAAERLGVPVWAELEFAARFIKGVQIAITGTNGKTTTASLVGEMLRNAGKRVAVAGNIGLPLSAVAQDSREEGYTVIEVSSFQLEHIEQFHPHIAALLNLTPDHLNRHGTMEAYGALKEGMLRNQQAGDFFVYNAEDDFCAAVASRATGQTLPFSRVNRLDRGAWVEEGSLVLEGKPLCRVDMLSLPGPHNLENALAAAAIAGALDIPPAVIRHTLRTFAGVEHRMETVRILRGVRWINDSKGTNPESSLRGVEAMLTPTVLIAGGDEKGADFTAFAQAIAKNANIRHVLLIGRTAGRIAQALAAQAYESVELLGTDFEEAITRANALAQEGGAVLLSPACSSFDMFKDFEERGRRFKEIVATLA